MACEPTAAPSLTQGEYRYDFGDTAHHAGGLRYHGMSPAYAEFQAGAMADS